MVGRHRAAPGPRRVSPHHPRLLSDVGGTHARFAWQASSERSIQQVATLGCGEFATLAEALQAYLAREGLPMPTAAAIGVATPVLGDRVQMTNHPWSFSVVELQQALGLSHLTVVNDFEALAYGLPSLQPAQLRPLGYSPGADCAAVLGAPCAVLGPGTGLGVAGLVGGGDDGTWLALAGEGGHVTLAAADAEEAEVLAHLRTRFGHASAERALSGPGLVNLYEALCACRRSVADACTPAEVVSRARSGADVVSRQAVDLFCSLLGTVAGNLALTLGARGGVYIGGGVAAHLADELAQSRFRARFEQKGRFSRYLASIPTWLITDPVRPALLGASCAMDRQLRARAAQSGGAARVA